MVSFVCRPRNQGEAFLPVTQLEIQDAQVEEGVKVAIEGDRLLVALLSFLPLLLLFVNQAKAVGSLRVPAIL